MVMAMPSLSWCQYEVYCQRTLVMTTLDLMYVFVLALILLIIVVCTASNLVRYTLSWDTVATTPVTVVDWSLHSDSSQCADFHVRTY